MAVSPTRVVIVATHPIQYHIPWFRALHTHPALDLQVLYVGILDEQQQGHDFGVAFQWDIPLLDGYVWETLPTHPGSKPVGGFLSARLKQPHAVLKHLQPDVVILTGWQSYPLLQMLMACRRLGIACCVRGDSNGLKSRPRWVTFIHRLLLQQYQAFLSVGQANRWFYQQHKIPEVSIFDCRHFVENARFQEQAETLLAERPALRARWQIPTDAVCFCYAGKLVAKKRILDLLEALRLLLTQAHAPHIHLLVVGAGELFTESQAFVQQYGLPVSFTGFLNQSEIAEAYIASDCLVLPSDYGETWGLVVNEAMVCGRPAIVSDRVGCGPDLVDNGITGWRFDFGDTAMLAARLAEAAQHPDQLMAMGSRAQQRILDLYSVEAAVAGTIAVVQYLTAASA